MRLQFTTLDVFTTIPYLGNPLAVVRVPAELRNQITEEQKQYIAREFNLSEITFLHEPEKGTDIAEYDIFTPLSRMSFAGHPTIGTATYVVTHASAYPGVKRLKTVAGIIPFKQDGNKISVEIPHDVHIHKKRLPHPFPGPEHNATTSPTVPLVSIVKGMAFNLVPMANLEALSLPTHGLLTIPELYKGEHLDVGSGWDVGYTGTYFYVDLGYDSAGIRQLRTRSIGSREDPGTGSASADLCSYLALQESEEKGSGPFSFHLTQGLEMGRRCDLFVEVTRTNNGKEIERVVLSGNAVEVMDGTLRV
ncbi:Diaminopimelate epimerase-like protein [Corynespora cassiicola Philippines]|uniref:Diaminopimelate epimerase-like protein n=1 Tax=Corynespora cassiicola Philippines TaxID=1448308 RepID=A0A2T2N5P4_CORCC|nr:Diaminopimelate epimerase-like protein [Corynespora cassiicola Philippines]